MIHHTLQHNKFQTDGNKCIVNIPIKFYRKIKMDIYNLGVGKQLLSKIKGRKGKIDMPQYVTEYKIATR